MDVYKNYARKIPADVRQELIPDAGPIEKALRNTTDPYMQYLFTVWFSFCQPNADEEVKDIGCFKCRDRIQFNFEQMKPYLIDIEKESQLLKCLTQL